MGRSERLRRSEGLSMPRNAVIATLCAGLAVVILLGLGLYHPARTAPPARPEVPLVRMTFALGETSFAILLPQVDEIEADAGSPSVTIYDFTRGMRLQRQIRIATAPRAVGGTYDRERALASGRLEYRVTDNIGGGSGGPTGELTGRLTMGAFLLFVECTDQDGLGSTHPDWCLPYLDRLQVVQD